LRHCFNSEFGSAVCKNENTEVLFSEDEIQEATKVVEIPVE